MCIYILIYYIQTEACGAVGHRGHMPLLIQKFLKNLFQHQHDVDIVLNRS